MNLKILSVLLFVVGIVQINALILPENISVNTTTDCILNILSEKISRDLTLVNLKDDLVRSIQKMNLYKVSLRSFLSLGLGVINTAYIVSSENMDDLQREIKDLTKDFFWNPRAPFIVIMEELSENEIRNLFEMLHKYFIFNVILIDSKNQDSKHYYFYDFEISKSCPFVKEAIKTNDCKIYILKEFQETVYNMKTLRSNQRFKIPYSGCFLKFFMNPLIPYNFPMTNETAKIIGYDESFFKLVKELRLLNFTIVLSAKPQPLGQPDKNFEVTGLMKLIQNGTIDGMVGGIILSKNRVGPFDFVYPHAADRFLVFLPRPSQIEKWKVMFFTFSAMVWILILVIFCIVYISALCFKAFVKNSWLNPILVLFVTFGYFVGATYKINESWKARFLVVTWAIFTWLISCFYQSDLTSVFTTPQTYPAIESLKALVKLGHELHMSKVTFNYINNTKVFLYDYGVINKAKLCDDRLDCLKTVSRGGKKYTIVTEKYFLYLQKAFLNGNHESLFNILKEQHHLFITAYVRKGHPDIDRIRYLQSQFISSGLYKKQLIDLTFNNSLKYQSHEENNLKPLSIKDIEGLYYFFLAGCLLSFFVFLYEVLLSKPLI